MNFCADIIFTTFTARLPDNLSILTDSVEAGEVAVAALEFPKSWPPAEQDHAICGKVIELLLQVTLRVLQLGVALHLEVSILNPITLSLFPY